ncbi:MAG: hypothetical protein QXL73_01600 [Thermoplasmata archaeon]
MVLKSVYIIPHGDEIISIPNEKSKIMNERIKEIARNDDSGTVVIISPHSIRLSKMIGVVNTEYLRGRLKIMDKTLMQLFMSDRSLNSNIINGAEETEEIIYMTDSGKNSVFPLDFGSMIPLYFFGKRKISLIGQSRLKNRKMLIEFGRKLYRITESYQGTVSIIISADQAHTHSKYGPYGFSEYAKYYDQLVIKSIRKNDFSDIIDLDEKVIEEAKPDSYWNLLTFYGIINEANMAPNFIYYYIEKYFGMLLATSRWKNKKNL